MAITIQDVAKRAGVGLGTVSRVINDAEHVRLATRQKVEVAMRELGYHPNPHARNLKRQTVMVIGFLMTSSHRRPFDPFFSMLMSGLADAAGRYKYDLLVASCPTPDDELNRLHQLVSSNRIGGLIVTDKRINDPGIEWLQQTHFPFVSFGRLDGAADTPWLDVDSVMGVDLAVKHLVERGHSQIAFIGLPDDLLVSQDRLEAYTSAMHRYGYKTPKDYVITGCWNEVDGQVSTERLLHLPMRPTAIVASSDVIAFGVLRALHKHDLVPGKDVAVIGFDDVPMAAHSNPPLTTLQQPIYDIGAELVSMLIRFMDGQLVPSRCIEPKLIVRQSG